MTGPDESQAATRPISVAELLAKNGTLGAPPVTGRRRRRRGNADAVTVAELTGEIPIVRPDTAPDGDVAPVEHAHTPPELSEEPVARRGRDRAPERSYDPRPHRTADAEEPETPDAEAADVETADSETADSEAAGVETSEDETPQDETPPVDVLATKAAAAELMSPDPVDVGEPSSPDSGQPDELGITGISYTDTADSALFGGDSLVDELSRGSAVEQTEIFDGAEGLDSADAEAIDPEAEEELYDPDFLAEYYGFDRPSMGQKILRGLLTAGQSVLAVAFGAGLFLAFDQLWKWNSLVAMLLAILVTLGLVAGVWVVRKTEDIASTLIAVGVGLLVTFGPLALMHAG